MWVFIAKRSAGGKERPLIPAGGRQVVHGHRKDEARYKMQGLKGRFCHSSLPCPGGEAGIMEYFNLGKPCEIIQSNHQPRTAKAPLLGL